jgi:hypothetical protein
MGMTHETDPGAKDDLQTIDERDQPTRVPTDPTLFGIAVPAAADSSADDGDDGDNDSVETSRTDQDISTVTDPGHVPAAILDKGLGFKRNRPRTPRTKPIEKGAAGDLASSGELSAKASVEARPLPRPALLDPTPAPVVVAPPPAQITAPHAQMIAPRRTQITAPHVQLETVRRIKAYAGAKHEMAPYPPAPRDAPNARSADQEPSTTPAAPAAKARERRRHLSFIVAGVMAFLLLLLGIAFGVLRDRTPPSTAQPIAPPTPGTITTSSRAPAVTSVPLPKASASPTPEAQPAVTLQPRPTFSAAPRNTGPAIRPPGAPTSPGTRTQPPAPVSPPVVAPPSSAPPTEPRHERPSNDGVRILQ